MRLSNLGRINRTVVNKYLEYAPKFLKEKPRNSRDIEHFFLFYRICDHGYPKDKPTFITKENCLKNAIKEFPLGEVTWMVLADNVSIDTYNMICKYVPESHVKCVNVGNGAGTFRMVFDEAIMKHTDDLIYFLEDDYLHLSGAKDKLLSAAKCNYADYLTLYDHPDKYSNDSPNPFVLSGGEKTKLYWCDSHHWKLTNSTTMTFAAFADTLRQDKETFYRWTETNHPFDFQMFIELKLFGKRKLINAVPSLSTHGETAYLAKGIDWEKQI